MRSTVIARLILEARAESPHAAISPLPFIPITVELPPKQLDVASRAVLRYFEAELADDKREQADAFDHLVAICYRAVQPYFLRDRHGSPTVIDVPQFNTIDGHRTGHTLRKEGAALDATREWLQGWLLEFLVPYRTLSEPELIAAADSGAFRYVGNLCRLRLKGIVCRQLEREKKDGFAGFVSLDAPLNDEEDASRTDNLLGTDRQAPISSLAQHVSYDEVMLSVENARKIVLANVDELARLDLLTGLLAILMVAERVEEPYFGGLITRRTEEDKRDFVGRIEMMLDQAEPQFGLNDQDAVAQQRQDCDKDMRELLDEFVAVRQASARFVEQLSTPDLERTGVHPKIGLIRVRELLHEWLYHDLNHAKQVEGNTQHLLWNQLGNMKAFYAV
jgi:DinB family protein